MPYVSIEDFRYGMDRRRKRVAGQAGALWTGKNVHIGRGGDIERPKKFTQVYSLPAGTFGFVSARGQLYAFGSADLANSMPAGVEYQRLQYASASMTAVLDARPFAGLLYVIAEFDDGGIYHFYDGSRVTDWDAAVTASASRVAERLANKVSGDADVDATVLGAVLTVSARAAGTAFTIAVADVDGGADATQDISVASVQANVVGVAGETATADITIDTGSSGAANIISSVTAGADELLDASVAWTSSNAATAILLAASINNATDDHGYSASVDDATVTISAPDDSGAAANGTVLTVTVGGDVGVTADGIFAGGVDEVTAVKQIERVTVGGVIEIEDTFTITINGTDYKATGLSGGMGTSAWVHKKRVLSPVSNLWRFCMLDTPTVWDPNNVIADNDAGFLDVSSDTEGADSLVAAVQYQGLGAIFGQSSIVTYDLDVDPANFAVSTPMENTGTGSARSIVRYGNNDVFYLDPTGIRSLQALNSSNAPFVSDIGTLIDPFVADIVAELTQAQVRDAIGTIEPADGRFWLAIGGYVLVLSYFPSTGVKAWSYYEPGFEVSGFARIRNRLYARADDAIYLYGGEDGSDYPGNDEMLPVVELPFVSANTPATFKEWNGFDIACTNTWTVEVLYDPNNEDRTINVGTIDEITFNEMHTVLSGPSSMVALKLTCSDAGAATISSVALHYSVIDDEK